MNVLKFTRIALLGLACFAAGATSLFGQAGPPSGHDYAIVLDDVVLRPGVTVDLHLQVFVNDRTPCVGRTILAVPGFAHTAATFRTARRRDVWRRPRRTGPVSRRRG